MLSFVCPAEGSLRSTPKSLCCQRLSLDQREGSELEEWAFQITCLFLSSTTFCHSSGSNVGKLMIPNNCSVHEAIPKHASSHF